MKQQLHDRAGETVRVERLTPEECRQFDDMRWAQEDAEVVAKYKGQFVVPYMRQIVAHGYDVEAVLARAARKTRRRIEELPVIGIDDPLVDATSY